MHLSRVRERRARARRVAIYKEIALAIVLIFVALPAAALVGTALGMAFTH